jgi:hypothetical protein
MSRNPLKRLGTLGQLLPPGCYRPPFAHSRYRPVRVEIYADGFGGDPALQETKRLRQGEEAARGDVYSAQVPATHGPTEYTARVIPYFSSVAVPLEAPQILWQR